MSSGEERTEKPTPKKRKELRKKGVVLRSQELPQGLSMLVLVLAMPMAIKNLTSSLQPLFTAALSGAGDTDLSEAAGLARSMVVAGLRSLVLPVVLVLATVVLTNVMVTRERPNLRALRPRFEMLSPKSGVKRVFGTQGLVEFAKTAIKLALMVGIGYLAVRQGVDHLIATPAPLDAIVAKVSSTCTRLLFEVAAIAVFIGFLDLAWSIRKFRKQSRMTKQEVKDETKQSELNPHMRGAIRSKQYKLSRLRMMAAVTDATVVLTNPTHLSVALQYEPNNGGIAAAPVVVAKGAGVIALKIREKAAEAKVPIKENKPLARALYSSCEIGDTIPVELYKAVAEVLAAVYATKRRRSPMVPQPRQPAAPAAESSVTQPVPGPLSGHPFGR